MTKQEIYEKWQRLFYLQQSYGRISKYLSPTAEKILHIKITKIYYPEREKVLESRLDSKGVRLDVYVEYKFYNRSFYVEMQISNSDNLAKRMRYYQGLIDMDKLKKL